MKYVTVIPARGESNVFRRAMSDRFGFGLLAVLQACHTQQQAATKEVYEVGHEVQTAWRDKNNQIEMNYDLFVFV